MEFQKENEFGRDTPFLSDEARGRIVTFKHETLHDAQVLSHWKETAVFLVCSDKVEASCGDHYTVGIADQDRERYKTFGELKEDGLDIFNLYEAIHYEQPQPDDLCIITHLPEKTKWHFESVLQYHANEKHERHQKEQLLLDYKKYVTRQRRAIDEEKNPDKYQQKPSGVDHLIKKMFWG